LVRRGMGRVVAAAEIGEVGLHTIDLNGFGADGAIQFVFEGHDFATLGQLTGLRRQRIGIGDVFGDHPQTRTLRFHTRRGNPQCFEKFVHNVLLYRLLSGTTGVYRLRLPALAYGNFDHAQVFSIQLVG